MVFVAPAWLKIRNSGSASAVAGTSTPPSTTLNRVSRPRKVYFAIAYPAIAAIRVASSAPTPAYSALLSSQRRKTPSRYPMRAATLSNSAKSANHSGAVVVKSERVLVAATNSHHSGVRKYRVATSMTAMAIVRDTALSRVAPPRRRTGMDVMVIALPSVA
ncbi:hypothetical protein [Pseudolysinimonas sp.]|uniref:hypothetical protein n=1 Tax=Pseudolysinimonas sp. TaxID=2680009 RepID=UPI003C762917